MAPMLKDLFYEFLEAKYGAMEGRAMRALHPHRFQALRDAFFAGVVVANGAGPVAEIQYKHELESYLKMVQEEAIEHLASLAPKGGEA